MGNDRLARYGDVQLSVRENTAIGATGAAGTVHLGGLVMHSAIAVQSIRIRDDGDAKYIDMVIGLAKPQQSGSFEIDVDVDVHTHRIVFGSDARTVWQRKVVA